MRTQSRLVIMVAVAGFGLCFKVYAEELRHGPWTVRYDTNGVTGVSYNKTPILQGLHVTLFAPDYRKDQFSLAGCSVKLADAQDARVLIFEKATEAATCTARLSIAGNVLRWTAEMQMRAQGPFEMNIPIPAAIAELPSRDLCVFIGEAEHYVPSGSRLEQIMPKDDVRIVCSQFDLVLRADWASARWVFQDRRSDRPPVVRLVACISSPGGGELKASPGVELEVVPLSADEARRRELVFSQKSRSLQELPVKNAGFEESEGLSSWAHGPNASVDTDNPASGRQCARLVVRTPAEPNFYITQQVPVRPGRMYVAKCKIRCRDVQRAEGMRMPSVGAVLIHEWADKDGKWLQAGSYSEGLWGTVENWREVQCEALIAPENAGYAVIFLGLRATGTAWFDDVSLTEIVRHTVVLSPLDGAVLRDNRPTFRWRPDPYATMYLLECTGENFQMRQEVKGTQFRLEKPIPPGAYTWRVTAQGAEPSVQWAFTQTAPQDVDTTGPELKLLPISLTDPSGAVQVEASDPSGLDPRTARVFLDGKPWEIWVAGRGPRLELRPKKPWPRGGWALKFSIADTQGNETDVTSWLVCAPKPDKKFRWTRERGIYDGARHFLPLGMYQVPPEEMARVKKAGFNLVHMYTFEGSQDDVKAREFLDAARANGLMVFMGFDRGNYSGHGLVQRNWGHVARRIAALRDHPALLAWYLFDEPDLAHQYVSPESMEEVYQLIRELDPYHPVIVTFAIDNSVGRYPRCYDVHWTQVYGDTDSVHSRLVRHREMLPGGALAAILTCNDRRQSELLKQGKPIDDAAFTPTLQKFRADIAMALALGSSGLSWWWYGDKRREWLTAADVPHAWEWLSTAVAEVHEIEPLLTGDGEEVEAGAEVEIADVPCAVRARRVGEKAIVIVAVGGREGDAAMKLTVTVPALRRATRAKVLFEDREVSVADGVIRDTITPVNRHIYLIERVSG